MPLPNLIIIGAQKCGTTSMHSYLHRHRQIAMSRRKELDFFIEKRNWSKGVDWYASQFPEGSVIRGESSPNYTWARQFPGVPARMHSVVPRARLLFMVRDPVDRLISHWVHNYSHGREKRPLAEAALDRRYLERSMYWSQVSAFLEFYPRSQLMVVTMDELHRQCRATMMKVFDFLEVERDFRSPMIAIRRNRSSRKRRKNRVGDWIATTQLARRIDSLPDRWRSPLRNALYYPFSRRFDRPALGEADRRELAERLRDDATRFREFAGRDFAEWSV
jgi:Sulfotransferase domain